MARTLVVQGLGAHTLKTILPAIETSAGWSLAAVISRRADAAAEVAAQYGVRHHRTFADAVDAEPPDAVYLATEPSDHLASVRASLEAGVATVFCEKPLVTSVADARELLTTARAREALLCESLAYRFHPQFAALRATVNSDAVGGVAHGYARFSYPHLDPDNHRYDPAAGGGALLDAGVYPLSLGVSIMGDVPLAVVAGADFGDRNVDIAGHATLTDDGGRTFQCSWQMGSAYTNLARIVGANGSVEVDRPFSKPPTFDSPIVAISGWGERSEVAYEPADQFTAMLDEVASRREDDVYVERMHSETERRWDVIGEVMSSISVRRSPS